MKENRCPNCGAAVTTEICEYCHAVTGLDSNKANMEYPVIECKEVNIVNPVFLVFFIFIFIFIMFGAIFPIIIFNRFSSFSSFSIVMFLPFIIISIFILSIVLSPIIRYIKVKTKGKEINATVYGYMNDEYSQSSNGNQIVKLKVDTNEGPKFILYQMGHSQKLYKINSKIKLKVYKDLFMILNDNKYYF